MHACRWNFTAAPGWTRDECHILRLCLMRHGIGQWLHILGTGLLPGKLIQQLYGQTQRLLGQQSLAGVHVCISSHAMHDRRDSTRLSWWWGTGVWVCALERGREGVCVWVGGWRLAMAAD